MKRRLKTGKNDGFTIIEVMIVLAVTLVLFFIAASFVDGRQSQTEFVQEMNNIQAQVKQTINTVENGQYQESSTSNPYSCSAPTYGVSPTVTSATSSQGTNIGCIFLGKVLQFQANTNSPSALQSYIIVGNQTDGNDNPTLGISDLTSYPTLYTALPVESYSLEYGVTPVCMQYSTLVTLTCTPGSATAADAVAFGSIATSSTSPQEVAIIPITGSNLSLTASALISSVNGSDLIDNAYNHSYVDPAGGVQVCFNSSGGNESGLLQIGGVGGSNNVSVSIMQQVGC